MYELHVHELFDFDILKKTYLILESIRFFPIYIDVGGLFFTMHWNSNSDIRGSFSYKNDFVIFDLLLWIGLVYVENVF